MEAIETEINQIMNPADKASTVRTFLIVEVDGG